MVTTSKHAREARLSALYDALIELGIDPNAIAGIDDHKFIIERCARGKWSIEKTIANLAFRAMQ